MFGFLRKHRSSGVSTELDKKFFSRCACWERLDGHFVIHDKHAPRLITLDPWPEIVFDAADGQHTFADLISKLAGEYRGRPPARLADQIRGVAVMLQKEGLIHIHDAPETIPPYYAEEYTAESPEKRIEEMRADGLIDG